jgi:hypothetical protein
MPFVWLSIPGTTECGNLERNSIALLSCLAGGLDQPSQDWLGRHAKRAVISGSGLWNVDHVTGHYNASLLRRLAQLADRQE